ncbi:MAG: hypothetical protein ABIJ01_11625 [Pseudomonadota bacterium]
MRNIPLVIAYGIPDSKIGKDVRALTGKDGKNVFLSIGSKDQDTLEFQQRYDLAKAGKDLFDKVAKVAAEELEKLVVVTKNKKRVRNHPNPLVIVW